MVEHLILVQDVIGSNPVVPANGKMAEWFIASDLKSEDPQGSVGSNPTLSATDFGSNPAGSGACFENK